MNLLLCRYEAAAATAAVAAAGLLLWLRGHTADGGAGRPGLRGSSQVPGGLQWGGPCRGPREGPGSLDVRDNTRLNTDSQRHRTNACNYNVVGLHADIDAPTRRCFAFKDERILRVSIVAGLNALM